MTRRPDFRRALVGLPISLVVIGVFGWVKKDEKKAQRMPPKATPRKAARSHL